MQQFADLSPTMDQQSLQSAIKTAISAMPKAYCPYSRFPVGAVLITDDNTPFVGVNVENASYGGTICAERSAVVNAISNGHQKFKAIVVVTELPNGASPCGFCRQFMIEFGDFPVYICSLDGEIQLTTSTAKLTPHAFTPRSLIEHQNMINENEN